MQIFWGIFLSKFCLQFDLHNAEILYYKIVLCKFFWASSKNRVIRIRAIGNRVNRGMTVMNACIRKVDIQQSLA